MTISGRLPQQAFAPLEFLPISQAQKYVADLNDELSVSDGTPLWFVHDGQSGTSDDFVCDAQSYYNEHGTLNGTILLRLIEACGKADCSFRIWYASDSPGCHRELTEFTSFGELHSGIARLLSLGEDICVRYTRNGQQDAAPNANPGAPLVDSKVTKGPPSVS